MGSAGDRELAGAYSNLGLITLWSNGFIERVKICYEQAAEIYQVCGDRWEQALSRLRLGALACNQKDYLRAEIYFRDCLTVFTELGDTFGLGRVYQEMSILHYSQGDYDQARKYSELALSFVRMLRFHSAEQSNLIGLGVICRLQGDYDQAEIFLDEVFRIGREFNLAQDTFPYFYSGCINLHLGNYSLAGAHFVEQLNINLRFGFQVGIGESMFGLAAAAAGFNQFQRAAVLAGAGQAIHDAIPWTMSSIDRIEIVPLLEAARSQLGIAEFEALQTNGRAMSLDQAVAYAIETGM